MQRLKKKSTLHTRAGKLRTGPLSVNQLVDLIEKSQRPKDKQRYRNRLAQLKKMGIEPKEVTECQE